MKRKNRSFTPLLIAERPVFLFNSYECIYLFAPE